MGTGPWDLTRAGTPGRNRFLASDADRERVIDLLKAAFVQGVLTRDEFDARAGAALTARTYGHLAAITAGLTPGPPEAKPQAQTTKQAKKQAQPPATTPAPAALARRRVSRKAVAWGACAVVLPPGLAFAFLTYYGGFLVMFAFMFIGTVVCSKPPAPPRPGPPG